MDNSKVAYYSILSEKVSHLYRHPWTGSNTFKEFMNHGASTRTAERRIKQSNTIFDKNSCFQKQHELLGALHVLKALWEILSADKCDTLMLLK